MLAGQCTFGPRRLGLSLACLAILVTPAASGPAFRGSPAAIKTGASVAADLALLPAPRSPAIGGIVRIASVHFDGPSVERDRLHELLSQSVDEFVGACLTADQVQWKDCEPGFPDGTPEKNWPIVYVPGTKMVIKEAHFTVQGHAPLASATVTGTAALWVGSTPTIIH